MHRAVVQLHTDARSPQPLKHLAMLVSIDLLQADHGQVH